VDVRVHPRCSAQLRLGYCLRWLQSGDTSPTTAMDQATHNRMASFLWGIADDVLRDLFKRA
jgi:hypothetical protein